MPKKSKEEEVSGDLRSRLTPGTRVRLETRFENFDAVILERLSNAGEEPRYRIRGETDDGIHRYGMTEGATVSLADGIDGVVVAENDFNRTIVATVPASFVVGVWQYCTFARSLEFPDDIVVGQPERFV